MENEFKEYKSKQTVMSKTVNTATQKADDTKKGLADLTKIVNKLEKK